MHVESFTNNLRISPASTDQTLVARLLAEEVDIAVTDTQSRTALLHSVIGKHDTITQLLVAHHSELVRNRLNTRKGGKASAGRQPSARSSSQKYGKGGETGKNGASGVPDVVSDLQVPMVILVGLTVH